mmetsp:Transcript_17351/g.26020  ORF Transcript_17351/g.26020 Transcript_17351/m.26020 type:complete len:255 (-) Transcript_17351:79-843(-)
MGNLIKRFPGKVSSICFYGDCCICHSDLERVDEVRDYLYLGSCRAASNFKHLEDEKITHIINTADGMLRKYARNWHPDETRFIYHNIDLVDKPSQPISQHFEPCYHWIEKARERKDAKILLHCVQGKSRSVTIAIAYLMQKEKITVNEALSQIRGCRDVVHTPNKGFMAQLYAYEKKLGLGNERAERYVVKSGHTDSHQSRDRRNSKDDLLSKKSHTQTQSDTNQLLEECRTVNIGREKVWGKQTPADSQSSIG